MKDGKCSKENVYSGWKKCVGSFVLAQNLCRRFSLGWDRLTRLENVCEMFVQAGKCV